MKKLIAFLLAAGMCATLAFASCEKKAEDIVDKTTDEIVNDDEIVEEEPVLTEDEVKEDPLGTLSDALSGDADSSAFEKFSENCHVKIELKDIFNMEVWAEGNVDNESAVIELEGMGTDLTAYVDNDEIVFESDDIFDGKAYGLPLDNLKEDFDNAKFWEYTDYSSADFYAAFEEYFGISIADFIVLYEQSVVNAEEAQEEFEDAISDAIESIDYDVSADQIELNDGEVAAILIDFEVDDDLVEALCDACVDYMSVGTYDPSDLELYEESFEYIVEAYKESVEKCDVTIALNAFTGKICMVILDMKVDGTKGVISLDLGKNYKNSEKYILTVDPEDDVDDDFEYGTIEYIRKNTEEEFSRILRVVSHYEDEDETDYEAEFILDHETDEYVLIADAEEIVSGTLEIEEGYAKITVDQVEGLEIVLEYDDDGFAVEAVIEEMTIEFALDNEKTPKSTPEYINVFDMEAEAILELAEAVEQSTFAQLVSSERTEEVPLEYYESDIDWDVVEWDEEYFDESEY